MATIAPYLSSRNNANLPTANTALAQTIEWLQLPLHCNTKTNYLFFETKRYHSVSANIFHLKSLKFFQTSVTCMLVFTTHRKPTEWKLFRSSAYSKTTDFCATANVNFPFSNRKSSDTKPEPNIPNEKGISGRRGDQKVHRTDKQTAGVSDSADPTNDKEISTDFTASGKHCCSIYNGQYPPDTLYLNFNSEI